MGIADNISFKVNAIRKNMNVRMLRVRMSAYDILIIGKAHPCEPPLRGLAPLFIGKLFRGMDTQADMANGFAQRRAKCANDTEFFRQLLGCLTCHVGFQKESLTLFQVVLQRTAKAFTLDQLGDHVVAPRRHAVP